MYICNKCLYTNYSNAESFEKIMEICSVCGFAHMICNVFPPDTLIPVDLRQPELVKQNNYSVVNSISHKELLSSSSIVIKGNNSFKIIKKHEL